MSEVAVPPRDGAGPVTIDEELLWKGSPKWQADFGFLFFSTLLFAGGIALIFVLPKKMVWTLVSLGVSLTAILMAVGIRIKRRNEHYKVTNLNLEYQRGVFSTNIDNLELWRVKDIKYYQNLFDKMLGVSKVCLFTQDESHPELWLIGLPPGRQLYDQIKKSVHIAKQSKHVVGMTQ